MNVKTSQYWLHNDSICTGNMQWDEWSGETV